MRREREKSEEQQKGGKSYKTEYEKRWREKK